MSIETAAIKQFEPGVFIRIDDVMTGIRKLARVTETGQTYIDLDLEDCTPFPIYATLNPEEAGNILGWGLYLVDHKPELYKHWKRLCERLINSGEGLLTYNRAALWAFQSQNFDYDKALAAARSETTTIARGRKALDEMAKNTGVLV